MSYGLQAEDAGSAVRWGASTDLTGWEVLNFTFESVLVTLVTKLINLSIKKE
jgi:hypothetical protein